MADLSSRELRNHTTQALRRVEAGERLRITVNGRPVADFVPLDVPQWASGAAFERILRDASADAGLCADLADVRSQALEPW